MTAAQGDNGDTTALLPLFAVLLLSAACCLHGWLTIERGQLTLGNSRPQVRFSGWRVSVRERLACRGNAIQHNKGGHVFLSGCILWARCCTQREMEAVQQTLIPFLIPHCRDNGVFLADPDGVSLVRLQSHCRTIGQPRQQTSPGHIRTALPSFVPDTSVLHNSAGERIADGVSGEAPCNLEQEGDSSVSQSPRREAGSLVRSLGCKNSRGDGGHPGSTPTNDLWRKVSTSDALNYLFKCLQRILRQWHINQMHPEPGRVVYINRAHLEERSRQCYISPSAGRWQGEEKKKNERRKFTAKKKLKILLFSHPFSLPLFSLPQIPAWMCRRARGMHQDEK